MFDESNPRPKNYHRWLALLEKHGVEEQEFLYMRLKEHEKGMRRARPEDVPLAQLPRKIIDLLADIGLEYVGQLFVAFNHFPKELLSIKHMGGVGFIHIKHCVANFRQHIENVKATKPPSPSEEYVLSVDQVLRAAEQVYGKEEAEKLIAATLATNEMLKTGNAVQPPEKFLKKAAKIRPPSLPDSGDQIASQFKEQKTPKKIKPVKRRPFGASVVEMVGIIFMLGFLLPGVAQANGVTDVYLDFIRYPHFHATANYHGLLDDYVHLFDCHSGSPSV